MQPSYTIVTQYILRHDSQITQVRSHSQKFFKKLAADSRRCCASTKPARCKPTDTLENGFCVSLKIHTLNLKHARRPVLRLLGMKLLNTSLVCTYIFLARGLDHPMDAYALLLLASELLSCESYTLMSGIS